MKLADHPVETDDETPDSAVVVEFSQSHRIHSPHKKKRQTSHSWDRGERRVPRFKLTKKMHEAAVGVLRLAGVSGDLEKLAADIFYALQHAKRDTLWERFYNSFTPEPNCGCWLWVGSGTKEGYGRITRMDPKSGFIAEMAHRASWIIHRGPIPDGLFVCHKCDVPACVNPEHLFLGTPAENSLDRVRKGRTRNRPSVRTFLDEQKVRDILKCEIPIRAYARRYGVSKSAIEAIYRERNWRYISDAVASENGGVRPWRSRS